MAFQCLVPEGRRACRDPGQRAAHHVVAFDYGVKYNILRMLVARGCRVTVLPAQTPASEALALNPDGIFLANGPGDPSRATTRSRRFRGARNRHPGVRHLPRPSVAGPGLRRQDREDAQWPPRRNHPVQDLKTGVVMITSQNHGFAVDEASLPANVRATHKSLFDGTLQGIERTDKDAFSFQGHPEASPGPHDVAPLFDRFIEAMAKRR